MVLSAIPSADDISDNEFHSCLERYPACLEAISEAKGARPGQKTLASLDQYRYGTAIDTFGSENANGSMGLDDVKSLVEWKLRHGKFRPTLMKLVSSNEPSFVKDTVEEAIKHYRQQSDLPGTLGILTKLKGIGPATASLLLAVHDAENVIFFADEAFYWLCCGGSKTPIKYNLNEYAELNERARALAKRLHVKAVDVERVAFVLMRESAEEVPTIATKPAPKPPADGKGKKQPAKRKTSVEDTAAELAPRRSKRGKRA